MNPRRIQLIEGERRGIPNRSHTGRSVACSARGNGLKMLPRKNLWPNVRKRGVQSESKQMRPLILVREVFHEGYVGKGRGEQCRTLAQKAS